MTLRVVLLDMFKLGRLPKRGYLPVQMPDPLVQVRIPRANVPDVALEMLDVDGIEAHNGRVETYVCFGGFGGGEQVWG